MTNIIENTYKTLANTGELDLTEKEYSNNYLGRCKSYYAYLKSTGRQASTEVLLKLWTQLKKAEQEASALVIIILSCLFVVGVEMTLMHIL